MRVFLLTVLLVAGLGGLNFQVLAGYDAQHEHFWNRLILPLAFFLGCLAVLSSLEARASRYARLYRPVLAAAFLCILSNAAARQMYVGLRVAPIQRASDPKLTLLRWVRSQLPPEQVIGSLEPEFIQAIPAISPEFTYVPSGLRSLTSTGEIVQRYYELAKLIGLSAQEFDALVAIRNHLGESRLGVILGLGGHTEWFTRGYSSYLLANDSHRRLDYVILPSERGMPPNLMRQFPAAKVVYCNAGYEVISVSGRTT
jgi:hypothetical protein